MDEAKSLLRVSSFVGDWGTRELCHCGRSMKCGEAFDTSPGRTCWPCFIAQFWGGWVWLAGWLAGVEAGNRSFHTPSPSLPAPRTNPPFPSRVLLSLPFSLSSPGGEKTFHSLLTHRFLLHYPTLPTHHHHHHHHHPSGHPIRNTDPSPKGNGRGIITIEGRVYTV